MNKVTAILGKRGCGKTTYVIKLLKAYHISHSHKKILVVDMLDHPLYREFAVITPDLIKRWKEPNIYRVFGRKINKIISSIDENLTNALIIFEDATRILDKNLQSEVLNMIIDSKQKNNDLIFIFHGFASIPLNVLRHLDNITIFKTDNPVYRKSDITFYDDILPLYNSVMKDRNPYAKKTLQIY